MKNRLVRIVRKLAFALVLVLVMVFGGLPLNGITLMAAEENVVIAETISDELNEEPAEDTESDDEITAEHSGVEMSLWKLVVDNYVLKATWGGTELSADYRMYVTCLVSLYKEDSDGEFVRVNVAPYKDRKQLLTLTNPLISTYALRPFIDENGPGTYKYVVEAIYEDDDRTTKTYESEAFEFIAKETCCAAPEVTIASFDSRAENNPKCYVQWDNKANEENVHNIILIKQGEEIVNLFVLGNTDEFSTGYIDDNKYNQESDEPLTVQMATFCDDAEVGCSAWSEPFVMTKMEDTLLPPKRSNGYGVTVMTYTDSELYYGVLSIPDTNMKKVFYDVNVYWSDGYSGSEVCVGSIIVPNHDTENPEDTRTKYESTIQVPIPSLINQSGVYTAVIYAKEYPEDPCDERYMGKSASAQATSSINVSNSYLGTPTNIQLNKVEAKSSDEQITYTMSCDAVTNAKWYQWCVYKDGERVYDSASKGLPAAAPEYSFRKEDIARKAYTVSVRALSEKHLNVASKSHGMFSDLYPVTEDGVGEKLDSPSFSVENKNVTCYTAWVNGVAEDRYELEYTLNVTYPVDRPMASIACCRTTGYSTRKDYSLTDIQKVDDKYVAKVVLGFSESNIAEYQLKGILEDRSLVDIEGNLSLTTDELGTGEATKLTACVSDSMRYVQKGKKFRTFAGLVPIKSTTKVKVTLDEDSTELVELASGENPGMAPNTSLEWIALKCGTATFHYETENGLKDSVQVNIVDYRLTPETLEAMENLTVGETIEIHMIDCSNDEEVAIPTDQLQILYSDSIDAEKNACYRINDDGTITGKQPGNAIIRIKYQGITTVLSVQTKVGDGTPLGPRNMKWDGVGLAFETQDSLGVDYRFSLYKGDDKVGEATYECMLYGEKEVKWIYLAPFFDEAGRYYAICESIDKSNGKTKQSNRVYIDYAPFDNKLQTVTPASWEITKEGNVKIVLSDWNTESIYFELSVMDGEKEIYRGLSAKWEHQIIWMLPKDALIVGKTYKARLRQIEIMGSAHSSDWSELMIKREAPDSGETGGDNPGSSSETTPTVHHFAIEFTIDKEATCTEKGSKSKHCTDKLADGSNCTGRTEVTEIPALGHTLDDGTVNKRATELAEGELTKKCKNAGCDHIETIKIAKIPVQTNPETNDGWEDVLEEDKEALGGISTEVAAEKVTVVGVPDAVTYTGTEQTFDVRVYYGKTMLIEDKDYIVKYVNNKNAAGTTDADAPAVVVEGKGTYAKTAEKTALSGPIEVTQKFTINAVDITNDAKCVATDLTTIDDGTAQTPIPVLTYNGKKLIAGSDYDVAYEGGVQAITTPGTYQVTLIAKGNYIGTKTVTYRLIAKETDKLLLTKVKITGVKERKYANGDAVEQNDVKVALGKKKLVKDTDYVIEYHNNTDIGIATMVIKAKEGSKYIGEKTINFKITGNELSRTKVIINNATKQTYTGSRLTPEVTVKSGRTTLIEGKDYQIEYRKNINAGKATIVLTGKGAYSGTVKKTFKIKTVALSSKSAIQVEEIPDQQEKADQTKVEPEVKVVYMIDTVTGKKTVLKKGIGYTVSYKNNTNAATNKSKKAPQVIIKGKGNYSGSKVIKFNIVK